LEVEGTALLFLYLSKKLDADICQKGREKETSRYETIGWFPSSSSLFFGWGSGAGVCVVV
jgi:hypothetical protein